MGTAGLLGSPFGSLRTTEPLYAVGGALRPDTTIHRGIKPLLQPNRRLRACRATWRDERATYRNRPRQSWHGSGDPWHFPTTAKLLSSPALVLMRNFDSITFTPAVHSMPERQQPVYLTRAFVDLVFGISLCCIYVLSSAAPAQRRTAAVLAIGIIGAFAIREYRLGMRSLSDIGLRRDNLADSIRLSAVTLLPLVLGCTVYSFFNGVYRPAHFAAAILIYPIWGLVQQIFFQGVILEACRCLGLGKWSILLTSALFVLSHYPSTFLMKATAIGGPLLSLTYFHRPNVIPLAIYHGIFGAFLYYVFRQKDLLELLFL